MITPSYPLIDVPSNTWTEAVGGPVTEALITGTSDFYYVWAEFEPTVNSMPGHHRQARRDLVALVPDGMSLWVRSRNRPITLTITIDTV